MAGVHLLYTVTVLMCVLQDIVAKSVTITSNATTASDSSSTYKVCPGRTDVFNCSISASANPIALCWGIAEDGLPNCGEVLFLVNDSSNLNTVSWPATNAIFQAKRIQCGMGNVLCSSLIPVFRDDTKYLNYTISCISDEVDTIVIRFLQSCDDDSIVPTTTNGSSVPTTIMSTTVPTDVVISGAEQYRAIMGGVLGGLAGLAFLMVVSVMAICLLIRRHQGEGSIEGTVQEVALHTVPENIPHDDVTKQKSHDEKQSEDPEVALEGEISVPPDPTDKREVPEKIPHDGEVTTTKQKSHDESQSEDPEVTLEGEISVPPDPTDKWEDTLPIPMLQLIYATVAATSVSVEWHLSSPLPAGAKVYIIMNPPRSEGGGNESILIHANDECTSGMESLSCLNEDCDYAIKLIVHGSSGKQCASDMVQFKTLVCLGEASVSNTTSCSTSIAWPWGKLNPNDAVTLTMKNFITNKRVLTNTVRRSDGHQTKVDVLPATAYEVKIHSLTAYCDPIYFLTPVRVIKPCSDQPTCVYISPHQVATINVNFEFFHLDVKVKLLAIIRTTSSFEERQVQTKIFENPDVSDSMIGKAIFQITESGEYVVHIIHRPPPNIPQYFAQWPPLRLHFIASTKA